MGASARLSIGSECAARRDAIRVRDPLAFGRFRRVSRCSVQFRNNAAAELCDSCERVHLTAIVCRGDGAPDREGQRRRIKARRPQCGSPQVRRGLTAERRFSKMTALGVASRWSRAAAPHVCVARSSDTVESEDHRRRDFVFLGRQGTNVDNQVSHSHGFMTALIRYRISAMRQTGEGQFGASWTVRGRGVEAGALLPPRLSARGLRDSKQHQAIQNTGAEAEMRGRTS